MIERIALGTDSLATAPELPDAADGILLARFQERDESAFSALCQRYGPMVHRRCRDLVGASDADDAAQGVFVVLARKPDQASRSPSLAAWLLAVSRRVCANALRARRRRQRGEAESATSEGRRKRGIPASHAPDDDLLDEISCWMRRLTDRERAVVSQHLLDGVSHQAIAERMGAPVATVRSHYSRGLARLREEAARRRTLAMLPMLIGDQGARARSAAAARAETARTLASAGPAHASPRAQALAASILRRPPTRRLIALASAAALVAILVALLVQGSLAALSHAGGPITASPPASRSAHADQPAAGPSPTEIHDPQVADANVLARLIDWRRTSARWPSTPYAALLAQPAIGAALRDSPPVRLRWNLGDVGLNDIVLSGVLPPWAEIRKASDTRPGLSRITLGGPMCLSASVRRPQQLMSMIDDLDRAGGTQPADASDMRSYLAAGCLVLMEHGDATHPLIPSPPPSDPDADVLLELLGPGLRHSVSMRLDADGLKTSHTIAMTGSAGYAPWAIRPADIGQFSTLPADTLAAFARSCRGVRFDLRSNWHALRTLAMHAKGTNVGMMLTNDGMRIQVTPAPGTQVPPEQEFAELAARGLPGAIDFTGDVVAYIRAGPLLPTLTIRATMAPESGHALLAALGRAMGAAPAASGDQHVHGFWMYCPVDADYIDGQLIFTTAMEGAAAAAKPAHGFADLPDVARALAEIPPDAYAAAVARPLCWRMLFRAAAMMMDSGDPEDVALAEHGEEELKRAWSGTHEVIYATSAVTSTGTTRTTVCHGPIFGLIGVLLDAGCGELPLVSIPN